jgi:hypothetical protein
MTFTSCPADEVHAPIEVVWRLLTNPAEWGTFYDVRNVRVVPPGRAHVGQRVIGESGPSVLHLEVAFVFTLIDEDDHRVGLDVCLPLGIKVREDLGCLSLGPDRCRVNYRCDFEFPSGLRGWLVHRLLRRELGRGPADSLARLKRAAETETRKESARSPA